MMLLRSVFLLISISYKFINAQNRGIPDLTFPNTHSIQNHSHNLLPYAEKTQLTTYWRTQTKKDTQEAAKTAHHIQLTTAGLSQSRDGAKPTRDFLSV